MRVGLGFVIVLTAVCISRADSVVLSADRDNTMYSGPAVNNSNGAGDNFFAGAAGDSSGGILQRGLIHFDLAGQVPSGATVTNVELRLTTDKSAGGGASLIGLFRATAPWGEAGSVGAGGGGSGGAAQPGDATWNFRFFNTTPWASAGGDFAASPSAQSPVNVGSYSWSGAGLVADVQAWVDNTAPNCGWVLIGDESAIGTSKRFVSRTNPTVAARPSLEIGYYLPTGAEPEIQVLGTNGVEIADGDATPEKADGTDMGLALVGGTAVDRSFMIRNTGSAPLVISGVTFTGADSADFTSLSGPGVIGVAASSNLSIRFRPGAAGLRLAGISLLSNDANESPYDFAIQGSGVEEPSRPVRVIKGAEGMTVTFEVVTGMIHTVEYRGELNAAPAWTNVQGAPHQTGVATDPEPLPGRRFYRVKYTMP